MARCLISSLNFLGAGTTPTFPWDQSLHHTRGASTTTSGWLRVAPVAVVVAVLLVALTRGIRRLGMIVGGFLHRRLHVPRGAAKVVGAALTLLLVAALVNNVVLERALSLADSAFGGINDETYPGVVRPSSPSRSGSPTSLVPWESLGKEGRAFVASGLPPAELGAAGRRVPVDPIRAYVGLASAPDGDARARLAVTELERTGALDRPVIAVVTTTGTGWIEDSVPNYLELLYGGDTAIVATQYSYLPSYLSFLVDRTRAEEAGRVLFDAVRARIDQLPPDRRPRLLAFGESLGSQGSESAFSSLEDVRAQADGALWMGPPNSNRLWTELVSRRDPGSREVDPVLAGGAAVRFGSGTADLTRPPAPWSAPRVAYLQHPSDPVVWWSPELLWRRPDWLVEPRGDDVLPSMSWYPVVTFWQITIDMCDSQSVPDGHGHNYRAAALDGWLAVAAPPGWTSADTDRVRAIYVP